MASRRRGPGRPPAADPVIPAQRVLQHALEAFADQGYEAVSVRRLSTSLEMGHTFLSDRYGSKEGLWKAAVQHAMEQSFPAVAAALTRDDRDDLDRLEDTIRALHGAAARSPHFARLIDQEARVESWRLQHLYDLLAPWNAAIRDLFDRLSAAGQLRPMPFYLFYFLVTSPTSIYSQPPLARRLGRPEGAQDHEQLTALVLASILKRPPPEG